MVCSFCSQSVLYYALSAHQEAECEMRPLRCKHCDAAVTAASLAQHEDECPKRPLQCQWYRRPTPAAFFF